MSDDDGEGVVFLSAALVPSEWQIVCPACSTVIPIDASEQDDASFAPDDGDRFTQCFGCAAHIEVKDVRVTLVSE